MGKWSWALLVTAVICILLVCYIYFVYRWRSDRIATLCARKFTLLDSAGANIIGSYGDGVAYAAVPTETLTVSDDKTAVDCIVEIRNKETQIPLRKVSAHYEIVRDKNDLQSDCSLMSACIVV